jgi:hypothetical protein
MKCAAHAKEAMGVCVRCGKAVCADCPQREARLTCSASCAEFLAASRGNWRVEVTAETNSLAAFAAAQSKRQIHFSVWTLLVVTFWVAVFFMGVALEDSLNSASGWKGTLTGLVYASLIVLPPAAAMGAICKFPKVGLLCGFASIVAVCLADVFL